jgi:hypothetical protein
VREKSVLECCVSVCGRSVVWESSLYEECCVSVCVRSVV